MDILVQCPANVATGGTESIHNFVSTLAKLPDVNARVYYVGGNLAHPCPQPYEELKCDYVTELPQGYHGVVIFPEIYANKVCHMEYNDCVKSILWLGVGAFYWHNNGKYDFLNVKNVIQLTKSAYADDFLHKLGVMETIRVPGGLNEAFYAEYEEKPRTDVILYNPAKADKFTADIIKACPEYQFKPIQGYSREEVVALMRSSKLYIDFGNHPGRERIPREAVLCGCCILTSKSGAAFYDEDVSIPLKYKFEKCVHNIYGIKRAMRGIIDDYAAHAPDFDRYREILRKDREQFPQTCAAMVKRIHEIQHNNSRI